MKAFVRATLATFALFALVSCSPRGDFPEYPDTTSHTAHNGPWAEAIAPLEAAYDRRDDVEVNRLVAQLGAEFRDVYGEDSVPYAEITMYAALQLYREHRDEASLPYFRDALQHYRAALGSEHQDVAVALHTYGDALISARGASAAAEAEPLYREAYTIRFSTLGAADIQTLGVAEEVFDAMSMQVGGPNDQSQGRSQLVSATRTLV